MPIHPDVTTDRDTATRLAVHVDRLCRHPRSRRHHPAGIEAAERYITDTWAASGWNVTRDEYRLRGLTGRDPYPVWAFKLWPYTLARNVVGVNLIARHPAWENDDRPPLVIGAHYDTVARTPGADDNASGVALLLELARRLPGLPVDRPIVLVAFDHEETGKSGSRRVARHFARREPAYGMVNLESVGVYTDEPDTQRLPQHARVWLPRQTRAVKDRQRRGNFTALVTRPARRWDFPQRLDAAALAAADGPDLITCVDRRPRVGDTLLASLLVRAARFADRSDHRAFWKHRIPAAMITCTAPYRNRHYHQPDDTPDRLNYPAMNELLHTLLAALTR